MRNYIGIIKCCGEVKLSYCHNYGGLEDNGGILFNFYNNTELVNELLNGGGISTVGLTIEETEFYNEVEMVREHDNLTLAMKRFKRNKDIEFIYLYSEIENKWYVDSNYYRKGNLKSLEEELKKAEKKKKIDIIYKKSIQMTLY